MAYSYAKRQTKRDGECCTNDLPPACRCFACVCLHAYCAAFASSRLYPKNNALSAIRINELGYLPHDAHLAVLCSLQPRTFHRFRILDAGGKAVFTGDAAPKGPYGPCVSTYDLTFSKLTRSGTYRIDADGVRSPVFRIRANAYAGVPGMLLNFMRDERSGYNPLFHAYVHQHDWHRRCKRKILQRERRLGRCRR